MGRTASPVTPGTQPTADQANDAPLEEAVLQEGLKAEVAISENDDLRAQIKAMQAQMKLLARNQIATAMPEKVELPEIEDVMKDEPTISVLTKQGWYVPPVHPTDRKVG